MAKLRVGLVFGGRSVEHEVSLASATSIFKALDPTRYEVRLVAIDHAERAFIAYAVYTRYGGSNDPSDAEPALALLSAESAARARLVGMALRLAYTLSAGVPFLLRKTELRLKDGKLRVKLPDDGSIPSGEVVERRLEALVEATLAKNGRVIE